MDGHWADELDRIVDEYVPEMVALRRYMHIHPEPSGAESGTSSHLYARLADAGVQVRLGAEGRGVIADDGSDRDCPRMALRADIDALRIQDRKQVEYCSQTPGLMHACGHDGHTATVYGAILALRRADQESKLPWPVCWRGIFQPAEETSTGANEMIALGALNGVDAIISLHMDPSRRLGNIGVRVGALTAACDEMKIRIKGRGGHAARPHESIDPIAAAAQLISSIYLFVPRAIESYDPVVVTIGQVIGGDNANVIPEEVFLNGTLRTLGGALRERTKGHLRQLARGIAEASGTTIEVEFNKGPDSVNNDPRLTALFREAATALLGTGHVEEIPRPSMGGEDFAHYLEHVPGSMFRLGCVSESVGGAPLHSPLFDIDERALAIGAKILARTTVLWSNPDRQHWRG